jgi:succinate dehydrogenase / fumarate reductase flavoprotein subunit
MEFFQFHPTGIMGLGILISEAVRGEGGILRNRDGRAVHGALFADPAGSGAPGHRGPLHLTEMRAGQGIRGDRKIDDYVHLDATHLGKETLSSKLPDITGFCKTYLGIDPADSRPYRCCPRPTTPWAASPRMCTAA